MFSIRTRSPTTTAAAAAAASRLAARYLTTISSSAVGTTTTTHTQTLPVTLRYQISRTLSRSSLPTFSKTTNPFSYFHQIKRRTMSSAAAAKRLANKTVVITGASSGIGRSTAFEFARTAPNNGLKLILTARRVDALEQIAKEIREEVGEGVQVLPVKLDVSQPEEVRGFVGNLPEEWRDINVLVNNAFVSPTPVPTYLTYFRSNAHLNDTKNYTQKVAQAPSIAEADINVMFATNVTGLINMTQAILPIFKARGNEGGSGDIINIGSIAGREPYAGGSIYCATKAAVRSFTDALRKELIATRIRIMEIDPGQVETEFSVVRFYGDKNKADAVYAGVDPLTPDDIAEIVVFVATRKENVVVADTLVFPSHQAGAGVMHRKST
ncbi:hypothetical protein SMACR_03789 [Sordaria macrospora]|uniref:Oxidoreductase n=1 Tax=Sordaria macrospora TaxID=5147 RepID=A0A8S9A365_SORMA|nr:hypothetical protein SMACR_03789 [Sordaria macrospora]WPJ61572.1 hypothetical protein SMAC4_03789 [Sordaria macrospora]